MKIIKKTLRKTLELAFITFLIGCGGGGGGGSSGGSGGSGESGTGTIGRIFPTNLSYKFQNIITNDNLNGIEVKVGNKSCISDIQGVCTINGLNKGDYSTIVESDPNYFRLAGTTKVTDDSNITEIPILLIPIAFDLDEFNRIYRGYEGNTNVGAGNGKTQRISDEKSQTLDFYVESSFIGGMGVLPQSAKDCIVNPIENDWPNLTNGKININYSNGRLKSGYNPSQYWWSNRPDFIYRGNPYIIGGGYGLNLENNEIVSGNIIVSPNITDVECKQLAYKVLGARGIPNSAWSILNGASDYTDFDKVSMNINYKIPPGSSADNRGYLN